MYASGADLGAAVPVKEKNEKNIKNVLTTKMDSVIIKSIQKRYNKHTSQKDI